VKIDGFGRAPTNLFRRVGFGLAARPARGWTDRRARGRG